MTTRSGESLQRYTQTAAAEITAALAGVDHAALEKLAQAAASAPRVFAAGAGRSGLALKAFAMRLMHLGIPVHVVGESTTPGISPDELLVIGSGSGRTASLVSAATKAKQVGAMVALVTIDAQSPIAQQADIVVTVPAPSPKASAGAGRIASIQPMGSLFEQTLWLTLDCTVLRLMELMNLTTDQMFARHANLE